MRMGLTHRRNGVGATMVLDQATSLASLLCVDVLNLAHGATGAVGGQEENTPHVVETISPLSEPFLGQRKAGRSS